MELKYVPVAQFARAGWSSSSSLQGGLCSGRRITGNTWPGRRLESYPERMEAMHNSGRLIPGHWLAAELTAVLRHRLLWN